ncbi:hypothetical protein Taro_047352, partial [Colocasia esculenta]|nr:hypothetical protein [Colocasia esculenta]
MRCLSRLPFPSRWDRDGLGGHDSIWSTSGAFVARLACRLVPQGRVCPYDLMVGTRQTPDCCFGNPFLGVVRGGIVGCSSLTSWCVRGAGWFCLWDLDLVEVQDVGACVVRHWSHVVAPVFCELLCLGGCVPRCCFHIVFDSAGSAGSSLASASIGVPTALAVVSALRVLSGCLVQTPDCCFSNPFLGAVHGGTVGCGGCAYGETVLLTWLLGVSRGDTWLFLPDLVEVRDVGACVMRLWSHVVAPVFRELLCLGRCLPRCCFRIVFDSAGSTGVMFGPTLVVGRGVYSVPLLCADISTSSEEIVRSDSECDTVCVPCALIVSFVHCFVHCSMFEALSFPPLGNFVLVVPCGCTITAVGRLLCLVLVALSVVRQALVMAYVWVSPLALGSECVQLGYPVLTSSLVLPLRMCLWSVWFSFLWLHSCCVSLSDHEDDLGEVLAVAKLCGAIQRSLVDDLL